MFSSFGEDALLDRLVDSGARLLFTKRSYLRKISFDLATITQLG